MCLVKVRNSFLWKQHVHCPQYMSSRHAEITLAALHKQHHEGFFLVHYYTIHGVAVDDANAMELSCQGLGGMRT